MLRSTRQGYHRRIAEALEDQFRETVETQPELLAYHYTEAGLHEQSILYWQQAGEQAEQRFAHAEAIAHLTTGLELKTLPDKSERGQQELTLQLALGMPLATTKGYAAPEVERAYTRAWELCQQLREMPQTSLALFGLWRFYLLRGALQTAQELGEQLLSLSQETADSALLLEANFALGNTLFWLGKFAQAKAHWEQSIALYIPQQHRFHAFVYGQEPGVCCRIFAACTLWYLGYPDQAIQNCHEALTLAHQQSHAFSQAFALNFAVQLHQLRQERPLVKALPTKTKGRRHPPNSPKSATKGIASTGPKKLALMRRLIGLPRWAGGKWSAMAAMLFGGIIAAPTPVRRRHASNAP